MGIHNLMKYMKSNDQVQLLQYESGDKIYMSNIVYFDITYKLIEIYNINIGIDFLHNFTYSNFPHIIL